MARLVGTGVGSLGDRTGIGWCSGRRRGIVAKRVPGRSDRVQHPGSTKLLYQARAIDDLVAWLKEQGDWVALGAADEQKSAADGTPMTATSATAG